MLKLLVLTKNNPIEILDVAARLHQAVGFGCSDVVVNSPQFIAQMVSEVKKVSYLKTYYPALRAYRNIEKYMKESGSDILVTVGTIGVSDSLDYDGIVGIDNPEIQDYTVFDEDFNTDNIKTLTIKNADILFNNMEELIHFIRIAINNYRKEKNTNVIQ